MVKAFINSGIYPTPFRVLPMSLAETNEAHLLLEIIVGDHLNDLRDQVKQAVEIAPPNSRKVDEASDHHHNQYPEYSFHRLSFPLCSQSQLGRSGLV